MIISNRHPVCQLELWVVSQLALESYTYIIPKNEGGLYGERDFGTTG